MSLRRSNLILMHAPSVYDFRKMPIMYGPISDVVPSTGVFEMYPVGFSSMAQHLKENGYRTRIINVAVKMLHSEEYDPEKQIAKLDADLFGIDLHWMPHAHGSIELARLIKKHHPDKPVIFGGFSSSYFHRELLEGYPEIDYVLRGDCTERPLKQLMDYIVKGEGRLEDIPNLTFRRDGEVVANELTVVPDTLDEFCMDYRYNVSEVIKTGRIDEYMPVANWLTHPIAAVLSCKGCVIDCKTCGGSKHANDIVCSRKKLAQRSPEKLVEDMVNIQRFFAGAMFVLGDLWQGGEEYVKRFLEAASKQRWKRPVIFEIFNPTSAWYMEELDKVFPNWSMEISIESHEEKVRHAFGKMFTNAEFEEFLVDLMKSGCKKLDVYFITGLPYQTADSVLETVDYSEYLFELIGGDKRFFPFISPLAPFVDPGSIVFEDPEQYGYRLLYKTIEEYRQALTQPSWKNILNYETKWMTRDELALSTYQAGLGLNRLKMLHGAIDEKTGLAIDERGKLAIEVYEKLHSIEMLSDEAERQRRVLELWPEIKRVNSATICDNGELEWRTLSIFDLLRPYIFLRLGPKFYKSAFSG